MAKFKYLIIDLDVVEVKGTNDEKVAKEFAGSDEFIVICNGEENHQVMFAMSEQDVDLIIVEEQTQYQLG